MLKKNLHLKYIKFVPIKNLIGILLLLFIVVVTSIGQVLFANPTGTSLSTTPILRATINGPSNGVFDQNNNNNNHNFEPTQTNAASGIEILYQTDEPNSILNVISSEEQFKQQRRPSELTNNNNNNNYLDNNSNIKTYLIKDTDGADNFGMTPSETIDSRVRELLDTIDIVPILRTGRTYPSTSNGNNNNYGFVAADGYATRNNNINNVNRQQTTLNAYDRFNSKQSNNNNNNYFKSKAPLWGFNWSKTPLQSPPPPPQILIKSQTNTLNGPSNFRAMNSRKMMKLTNGKNQHNLLPTTTTNSISRHSGGSEEVSFSTPIHAISDYEFKRVENTRWNNLRGMWGKRSNLAPIQIDLNKFDSNANGIKNNNQQQLPLTITTKSKVIPANVISLQQQQQHYNRQNQQPETTITSLASIETGKVIERS